MQQGIESMNLRQESSHQLIVQTQAVLSTALVQMTTTLNSLQARLDSLEKQQPSGKQIPQIQDLCLLGEWYDDLDQKVKRERQQMNVERDAVLRCNTELFYTNKSLTSHSEKQAQQLASKEAEIVRLQRDLQASQQQYKLLKATTDPLVRQAQATQAERQQRQRGAQLAQPNLGLLSAVQQDGYKIKKLPEATRKWHN